MKAAAELLARGTFVYAPIVSTHPIAEAADLPGGWEFWKEFDCRMLAMCTNMVVLMLPGWAESVGVAAETEFAWDNLIPVTYMPVEDS